MSILVSMNFRLRVDRDIQGELRKRVELLNLDADLFDLPQAMI